MTRIALLTLTFLAVAGSITVAYAQCRQTVCNNTPHGYVCRCM